MNLNFITKKRKNDRFEADVTIKVIKAKNNDDSVQIAFKNNCYKSISETEYLVPAISGNCLYFKSSDKEEGFKLSSTRTNITRYTRIRDKKLANWVKIREGGYDLKFDRYQHLFYIDTIPAIKKTKEAK